MTEHTTIEWANHTFSPWLGCSRVHAGCANCYAEAMAGRLGVTWGPNGTRRRTSDATWRQVERWNRQAANDFQACRIVGVDPLPHPRVFPSLCDPFEDWHGHMLDKNGAMAWNENGGSMTMDDVRRDFFALIDRCQNLDFLLLTKRPENIRDMWPSAYWMMDGVGRKRDNVWLLYSASDQGGLNTGLPHMMGCRSLTPVLGLSLEPLIGPVDLSGWLYPMSDDVRDAVDWVIVGGESGPHHRSMDIAWITSIAEQCQSAGVPLFVKQDCGRKAGQQGRIHDAMWARKEFPNVSVKP